MHRSAEVVVKPKVAYLMGAGASAQRLPVVANMAERMTKHLSWVREQRQELLNSERQQRVDKYIKGLEWVLEQMGKYVSVDTCARWLDPGGNELIVLKAVLSTFFAIEQHQNGYDPRYEAFVSTMLDFEQGTMHPDMVVLTWNYDQQLAMALRRTHGRNSLKEVMQDHRIRTLFSYSQGDQTDFSALHLNGIAGVFSYGDDRPILDRTPEVGSSLDDWNSWLYWFDHVVSERFRGANGASTFSYAWESMDPKRNMKWAPLEEKLSHVEKLIVIGYSFPDFNRPVDRLLIKSMGTLKEIVVQTSPTSMAGILTKLRMVFPEHKDKLVPYELTHEFYVPNELLGG